MELNGAELRSPLLQGRAGLSCRVVSCQCSSPRGEGLFEEPSTARQGRAGLSCRVVSMQLTRRGGTVQGVRGIDQVDGTGWDGCMPSSPSHRNQGPRSDRKKHYLPPSVIIMHDAITYCHQLSDFASRTSESLTMAFSVTDIVLQLSLLSLTTPPLLWWITSSDISQPACLSP